MAYNGDKTWDDLVAECNGASRGAINQLNFGQNAYDEWQSFRAGRTNAQIATAISRTETEVSEMDSAFSAVKALYDYANNQTPSQSDYFFSLRKFS